MSLDVTGFITWIRTFLDDVYAEKGTSGTDLELDLIPKSENSSGVICIKGGDVNYDLDKVYPVGSIYMSVNSTNPSTLFGGTWQQLTDTFLYASTTADTNSTTATGGSKDAVVVEHNHTQNSHNHGSGDNTYPNFMTTNINIAVGQTKRTLPSAGSNYYYVYSNEKGDISQHSTTDSKQPTINNRGVSGTDKNMPPYMKVYMWKRTA
jgi:hypothetical protein